MALTLSDAQALADAYTAAWNSGDPKQVASFYAEEGGIVINRGEPWDGRDRVAEMAAGFYADVPDLKLVCESIRLAGDHMVFAWRFTGHDAGTKAPLDIPGWEEWDLDAQGKVRASRGWFDADDYARQAAGG